MRGISGLRGTFLGLKYVPYINHSYGRSGTLWEGRYKASLIDEESYLFICMRYIELNPVRAAMVEHPRDYRWTSYHFNAERKEDQLITPHPLYLSLGRTDRDRGAIYKNLFKAHVEDNELSEIRYSWQTGTPLGNDRFRDEIEKILNRKVGQNRRGRPARKQYESAKGL